MATTVTLDSYDETYANGSTHLSTNCVATYNNRLAILCVTSQGVTSNASVNYITTVGNPFTWTFQGIVTAGSNLTQEIWTAPIPTAGSYVVTAYLSGTPSSTCLSISTFYLTAGNTAIPTISTLVQNLISTTSPTTSISTVYANDQVFGILGSLGTTNVLAIASPFTAVGSTIQASNTLQLSALDNTNTPTPTSISMNWTSGAPGVGAISMLALNGAAPSGLNVVEVIVGSVGTYGGVDIGGSPSYTYTGGFTPNGKYFPIMGAYATYNGVTQFTNVSCYMYYNGTEWVIATAPSSTGTVITTSPVTTSGVIPSKGWASISGYAFTLALITTGLNDSYCCYNYYLVNGGLGLLAGQFLPVSGSYALGSGYAANCTEYSNGSYNLVCSIGGIWYVDTGINLTGSGNYYNTTGSTTSFPLTEWLANTGIFINLPVPIFTAGMCVIGSSTMTLERASIYEGSQIGPEVTAGTAVAATHRLLNTAFIPDIAPDITDVRTQGEKFDTDIAIGKEHTTGKTTGKAAYYDLAYLFSSLCTVPVITTPANNSTWNITCTTSIATNTFGITFQNKFGISATLAAASYASLALLTAAIGGMASVGTGNVKITGSLISFTIQFVGALSTDPSVPTVTGTAVPTAVAANTATLTRRWTYVMNPWGPETNIQTFTLEKGIPATANLAQQIAQLTMTGLQLAFSNKEATASGDFVGMTAADPFTMTTGLTSAANIPSAVINPKDIGVYVGTSLFGANGVSRLNRVFAYEWGCSGRSTPVMTLDDSMPSMSNTVEAEGVKWTAKMTMAQDAYGQAQLANLRAGTVGYRVVEAKGPTIETGFPLRLKITEKFKLTNGPKTDTDGIYVGAYESNAIFDGTTNGLAGAFLIEIDIPLTAIT